MTQEARNSLADQIEKVVNQARALKQARNQATQLTALRRRDDGLSNVELLEELLNRISMLRQKGVPLSPDMTTVRSLAQQAMTLLEQFDQSAISIIGADPARRETFWNPLEQEPQNLEEQLKRAWASHVRAGTPDIDPALLEISGRMPGHGEDVRQINVTRRTISLISTTPPRDADEFERLSAELGSLNATVRASWTRIVGAGAVPEEVEAFLIAAASDNGAPLTQYTDDVRSWLSDREWLGRLSVRFARR